MIATSTGVIIIITERKKITSVWLSILSGKCRKLHYTTWVALLLAFQIWAKMSKRRWRSASSTLETLQRATPKWAFYGKNVWKVPKYLIFLIVVAMVFFVHSIAFVVSVLFTCPLYKVSSNLHKFFTLEDRFCSWNHMRILEKNSYRTFFTAVANIFRNSAMHHCKPRHIFETYSPSVRSQDVKEKISF